MAAPVRIALPVLLLCAAACHRSPAGDNAATAPPIAPAGPAATAATTTAATTPAAAMPATQAAGASYACADGTALQATFGDHDASLRWPDGRSITLPRAESASRGAGDVYVGATVSLQRDGTTLQLHDGDRPATACQAGGRATASDAAAAVAPGAAAHYACDAGTSVTRKEDGSFRVDLPNAAPVRLTRIAGSEPPVYTGSSLYLRIEADGAILSQGDRTNELRCRAG